MDKFRLIKKYLHYKKGTILYEYTGCTYGVISKNGIAVTEKPCRGSYLETPFFEVPKDLLFMIDPDDPWPEIKVKTLPGLKHAMQNCENAGEK